MNNALLHILALSAALWPLACLCIAEWRLAKDTPNTTVEIWPWLCSLAVVRVGLVGYWLAVMMVSDWWLLGLSMAAWDGWRLVSTLRGWGAMKRLRAEQRRLRRRLASHPDPWINEREHNLSRTAL